MLVLKVFYVFKARGPALGWNLSWIIPIKSKPSCSCSTQNISHSDEMLFSECNQGCSCAAGQWDPMCSDSGVTYVSPCLAGCRSSSGRGKNIVGLQTFNRVEYMFDAARRGDKGMTVLGVLLAVFPGHFSQQVFDNCSCVHVSSPANSSRSVRPGQCPQTKECSRSFTSYMAISVLSSFIDSLGVTPGYMVIIRSAK